MAITNVTIWIDADACPVKDEVYKVAWRYGAAVMVVSNARLRVPDHPQITRIIVDGHEGGPDNNMADNGAANAHGPKFDAVDDYIVQNIKAPNTAAKAAHNIVITADILLAERCLKSGAAVIAPNGKAFTMDSIGSAIATRAIMADLRAGMDGPLGSNGGGPAPFTKADRSRFLQELDRVLVGFSRS